MCPLLPPPKKNRPGDGGGVPLRRGGREVQVRQAEGELQNFRTQPPTVVCKTEAQFGMHTRCTHVFCTFGADFVYTRTQSVLIDQNFSIGARSEVY